MPARNQFSFRASAIVLRKELDPSQAFSCSVSIFCKGDVVLVHAAGANLQSSARQLARRHRVETWCLSHRDGALDVVAFDHRGQARTAALAEVPHLEDLWLAGPLVLQPREVWHTHGYWLSSRDAHATSLALSWMEKEVRLDPMALRENFMRLEEDLGGEVTGVLFGPDDLYGTTAALQNEVLERERSASRWVRDTPALQWRVTLQRKAWKTMPRAFDRLHGFALRRPDARNIGLALRGLANRDLAFGSIDWNDAEHFEPTWFSGKRGGWFDESWRQRDPADFIAGLFELSAPLRALLRAELDDLVAQLSLEPARYAPALVRGFLSVRDRTPFEAFFPVLAAPGVEALKGNRAFLQAMSALAKRDQTSRTGDALRRVQ